MNGIDGLGIDTALQAIEKQQREQDAVGQNQFLEMLVAQLENQDPLNPQDSADFAAQLAQFSTVEQLIAMRTGIDKLVATMEKLGESESGAVPLDPASLVGREVVVFGSQIEVDAARTPIELPLRTGGGTAVEATVRMLDAEGRVVHRASILPLDAQGRPTALRPGDHTFRFDPAAHDLPEGVYSIEFTARGSDGESVTVLPMETGVVRGAVVAGGEPALRIGNRLFRLDDVLEVRLAPSAQATSSEASGTGDAQAVVRPTAPAAAGAAAS